MVYCLAGLLPSYLYNHHCVGSVEPMYVLEQLELQIENVKAEAFSRKEILDKVEKWVAAREEECWLEEYNRVDFLFGLC